MPSSDVITLSPRLKLYKRDDRGGVYHLRARLKGRNGYVFRSTDEGDAKKATELAWEIFYKLQSQQDQEIGRAHV